MIVDFEFGDIQFFVDVTYFEEDYEINSITLIDSDIDIQDIILLMKPTEVSIALDKAIWEQCEKEDE